MEKMTVLSAKPIVAAVALFFTGSYVLAEEERGTELAGEDASWSDAEVQVFLQKQGVGAGQGIISGAETLFRIFGDVTYASKQGGEDKFSIGQLVLHGTADFGDGFGSLIEVTLNSDPDWETRLERLQVFWEQSDYLKLSFGRFHLPVTWWNSTFHHGLWLQTTARRPIMVGFDNAFIANHAIGLTAEGFIPGLEQYGLRYMVGVSGGDDDSHHSHDDGLVYDDVHTMDNHTMDDHAMGDMNSHASGSHDHASQVGPEDHQIMPMAGIFYQPAFIPRLHMGLVAYAERYSWEEHQEVDYLALGAHIAYTSEQPELILNTSTPRTISRGMTGSTAPGALTDRSPGDSPPAASNRSSSPTPGRSASILKMAIPCSPTRLPPTAIWVVCALT
jgi:hypothetical protein